MNTSVRVSGIALVVLVLATRGFADDVEDRASGRTPSQGDNVAEMLVIVPDSAEVWFDGVSTRQTGSHRKFWSPALTPIRARSVSEGMVLAYAAGSDSRSVRYFLPR